MSKKKFNLHLKLRLTGCTPISHIADKIQMLDIKLQRFKSTLSEKEIYFSKKYVIIILGFN